MADVWMVEVGVNSWNEFKTKTYKLSGTEYKKKENPTTLST